MTTVSATICLEDILVLCADIMTKFLTLRDVNNLGMTGTAYQKTCRAELFPLYFFKKLGRHARGFPSSSALTALQIHHAYLPRDDCVLHHRRGSWDFFFLHDPRMIYVSKNPQRRPHGMLRHLLHLRHLWEWFWESHPSFLWHNQLIDYSGDKIISNMMYYEVHINTLDADENNDVVSMGYSTFLDFGKCLERQWLVGWTESSMGMQSDDGYVYRDMVDFYRINKAGSIVAGDTIGCGYLLDRHQIFFTRNGELLYPYVAFPRNPCRDNALMHPCVIATSTTLSFSIQWTFPFLFDVYHFRQKLNANYWSI